MSANGNQPERGAAETCVETNNFRQVLPHFDDTGDIINKDTTRFSIECSICRCKDLALVNPQFDKVTDDTHGKYIVLPRCGHAFCHVCLPRWFKAQPAEPSCPTCRASIHCPKGHGFKLKVYGSCNGDATRQSRDIREMRARLKDDCEQCNKRGEQSNDEDEDTEQVEAQQLSTVHSSRSSIISGSRRYSIMAELAEHYGYIWNSIWSELGEAQEDFPSSSPTSLDRSPIIVEETVYRPPRAATAYSPRLRRSESYVDLGRRTREELDASLDDEVWQGALERVAREISRDSWEAEFHELLLEDTRRLRRENTLRQLRRWRHEREGWVRGLMRLSMRSRSRL